MRVEKLKCVSLEREEDVSRCHNCTGGLREKEAFFLPTLAVVEYPCQVNSH